MKKTLLWLVLGAGCGAVAAWLALRTRTATEHEGAPAPAAPVATTNAGGVHLANDQIIAAGITTASPAAAEWKPGVRGFGRVLDAAPLVLILGDIESARAAAQASEREYERLKALNARDTNAPARAVEAAEAVFRRDRVAVNAVQSRLVAEWGKALVGRDDLASLARSLVAQETALVRVDLPAGERLPSEPRRVSLALLPGADSPRDTEVVGPAPTADAQAQGAGLFVLLRAPVPPPGTVLSGWVSGGGPAQHGLRLPPAALVRHEGQVFVFVQTGPESFARQRVELGPRQAEGVLVTNGLAGTERVVVLGAQQLLAEELKSALGEE